MNKPVPASPAQISDEPTEAEISFMRQWLKDEEHRMWVPWIKHIADSYRKAISRSRLEPVEAPKDDEHCSTRSPHAAHVWDIPSRYCPGVIGGTCNSSQHSHHAHEITPGCLSWAPIDKPTLSGTEYEGPVVPLELYQKALADAQSEPVEAVSTTPKNEKENTKWNVKQSQDLPLAVDSSSELDSSRSCNGGSENEDKPNVRLVRSVDRSVLGSEEANPLPLSVANDRHQNNDETKVSTPLPQQVDGPCTCGFPSPGGSSWSRNCPQHGQPTPALPQQEEPATQLDLLKIVSSRIKRAWLDASDESKSDLDEAQGIVSSLIANADAPMPEQDEPAKPDKRKIRSECCKRLLWDDERYCPRCGWECRIEPIAPLLGQDELPPLDKMAIKLINILNPESMADSPRRTKYILACRERQLTQALTSLAAATHSRDTWKQLTEDATKLALDRYELLYNIGCRESCVGWVNERAETAEASLAAEKKVSDEWNGLWVEAAMRANTAEASLAEARLALNISEKNVAVSAGALAEAQKRIEGLEEDLVGFRDIADRSRKLLTDLGMEV